MAKGRDFNSFLKHRAENLGANTPPVFVHKITRKENRTETLVIYLIKFPFNAFYYLYQKGEKIFWRSRTDIK